MVNGKLASLASWLFHSVPLLWIPLGPSRRLPLPMLVQVIRIVMGLLGFAMDTSLSWPSFKAIGQALAL
jgi:hypothetical protein